MKIPADVINDGIGNHLGGDLIVEELEKEGYRIVRMSDIEMLENLLYHLQRASNLPVMLGLARDTVDRLTKLLVKNATPKKE